LLAARDQRSPQRLASDLAHESPHRPLRQSDCGSSDGRAGLFWFHPLVWWIGARLVERERLRRDVLCRGSEPEVYTAFSNVQVSIESPLASSNTGADLKRRRSDHESSRRRRA
jgi:hypothetical protein